MLRNLLASRSGQLSLDFRIEAQPAKVLQLRRREPPPLAAFMEPIPVPRGSSVDAEQYFSDRCSPRQRGPGKFRGCCRGVPACARNRPVSRARASSTWRTFTTARDEIAEAQALYERAIALEPDVFEAHFNLGNIFHDLGRYVEAQICYRDALRLNPTYADAHFYLAVTLEKSGLSREARPHWRAYQQLAPKGEWVDLAKEFSD